MNVIYDFFGNRVIWSGFIAWITAQILKTIINAIVTRSWDPRRLIGDGGMPSAHSATITAVALSAGIEKGFSSPLFGVAFFVAAIVMHDAMGVRMETQKQSQLLTELVEKMAGEVTFEGKLKQFVGHTPLQVFAGFCVGIITTLIFMEA